MKKILYLLILSTTLPLTTFAYYTNEQYRTDVRSYLDRQEWRQTLQDLKETVTSGTNNTNNAPTQADIDKLQKQYEARQEEYNKATTQINQLNDVLTRQEALTKQSDLDTRNNCLTIQTKQKEYQFSNIDGQDVATCASKGVIILTDSQLLDKAKAEVKADVEALKKNTRQNTLTPKQETKEQVEARNKKGIYKLDEIMNIPLQKQVVQDVATTTPDKKQIEVKKTVWSSVRNKIMDWFNF